MFSSSLKLLLTLGEIGTRIESFEGPRIEPPTLGNWALMLACSNWLTRGDPVIDAEPEPDLERVSKDVCIDIGACVFRFVRRILPERE